MRVHKCSKKLASNGGTRRPKDVSSATGVEGNADLNKHSSNDVMHIADNPEQEKISINLRKKKILGTWNVQGLQAGKLKIVTKRMEEQNIGILGVAETW